jgi:hypothetical protein
MGTAVPKVGTMRAAGAASARDAFGIPRRPSGTACATNDGRARRRITKAESGNHLAFTGI